MRLGEFLRLTPAEFFGIFKAWEAKQAREDLRLARLQLTIASSAGAKSVSGQDLSIYDFVPHLRPPPKPETSENLERQFLSCIPKSWHPPQDQSAASSSTSRPAPPS
jgi:hypothetical protein